MKVVIAIDSFIILLTIDNIILNLFYFSGNILILMRKIMFF